MNLYSGLAAEPRSLVREYQGVLDHLPISFLVSNLVELEKWQDFFEPEKAYFRALLKGLAELSGSEFQEMFGSLATFEARTGCGRVSGAHPEELRAAILQHLQRQGQYASWRDQIERIFQRLEPMIEGRLYSNDREPRLIVILYGEGMAIEREKLWERCRGKGTRVQLDLQGADNAESFLRTLFTGSSVSPKTTLFGRLRESRGTLALDCWIIEAGEALHSLCESSATGRQRADYATGLSYERLRAHRDQLTETIYAKVEEGIRGPLELASYLRTLQIRPASGTTLLFDNLVTAFIRDIFLAGAGTLMINNTFVEWGSVQALKRAQPHVLVARFGVRDKMKPFSSLLLFSKPRPTDQIPIMQDPVGSFVDAELLAYYIWLSAEKGPPYRGKTLYLLLAEGVDEMLVIPAGSKGPLSGLIPKATLSDVAATMAQWMRVELPGDGHPLAALIS